MKTVTRPRSKIQLLVAVLGVSCLLLQSASASFILSEAFNYTASAPLVPNTNPSTGQPWQTGNSGLTIASGDLSYPGLDAQGGNELNMVNGSSGNAITLFGNVTSGQIYYSFLLDVITADNGNQYFTALNPGTSSPNGSLDALGCYLYSNGAIAVRTNGKSAAINTSALNLNQTYFVVMEYDFSTSTANLWLNPTPYGSMGAPTLTVTGSSATSIDNVGFKAQNGTGHYVVDNLLIATTWNEVVPEPSTFALMGLGLGFIAAVIRRRRS